MGERLAGAGRAGGEDALAHGKDNMIGVLVVVEFSGNEAGIGSFHIHRGHAFEGFELRRDTLVALCACGETLDVASTAFTGCPECDGDASCPRCGGSGAVVDHAALEWRLP